VARDPVLKGAITPLGSLSGEVLRLRAIVVRDRSSEGRSQTPRYRIFMQYRKILRWR
jgi:hypothetical protein